MNSKVVFMCEDRLSSSVERVLSRAEYRKRCVSVVGLSILCVLHFLSSLAFAKEDNVWRLAGSPLSVKALRGVHAHEADATFILANKFSFDRDLEDASTLLASFLSWLVMFSLIFMSCVAVVNVTRTRDVRSFCDTIRIGHASLRSNCSASQQSCSF